MNESLVEMFRYNAWANRQLFEACRSLTEEQLDTHVPGTSGPVREILMHIAGAQQTFILRTRGRQHEGEVTRQSPWPGMDRLLALVEATNRELVVIAGKLDEEEAVDLSFQGQRYRFPARFFLVHAMAHGAEHRTEVKVALAQIGVETPDLDGWQYAAAAGYGQVVA
jgi:uncharacterized damage-inducible protein DinB